MSSTDVMELTKLRRHARLRWVGAPLLLTGLGTLGLCLAMWLKGSSGYPFFLGLLGTGLGLAAFGANHEATIALALHHKRNSDDPLPEDLGKELNEELERDRESTLALQAFPRTAMALPVLALAVQAGTAWLVLT